MRVAAVALVAALSVLTAGCASPPGPAPTPVPTPASVASHPAPIQDPSLLSILPADIGGVPVTSEPSSFSDALADPAFVANVEAAAFAVVVDGSDLASGVVARLRPGVYSDTFFRDWRDTYDEGACAAAEGVAGNAQATLGGRTVYISSCTGDVRIYHVYLDARGVLISLFSTGSRRFGEQVMSHLRP